VSLALTFSRLPFVGVLFCSSCYQLKQSLKPAMSQPS